MSKSNSKKNVLILHGWESNPKEHWYLKFKERLEKENCNVFVPEMPRTYFPKVNEWLKIVEDFHPDESWILIGHSLGGVTILKYLENAKVHIAKAILIATPSEPMKFNPIANFFEGGFNWEKIKNNCYEFEVLQENADPLVPVEHGKNIAESLGSKLNIQNGFTHFDQIDTDLLLKMIQDTRISP